MRSSHSSATKTAFTKRVILGLTVGGLTLGGLTLGGLTMGGLTMGFASGVNAQAPSPPSPLGQPSADIPDRKLDATAAAIDRVTEVKRDYQQKIDRASPAEKDRLSGEGNAALTRAVTDQGLTVDEYNAIIQTAQNDPAVKTRLLQRLNPAPNGSGGSAK